VAQPPSAVSFGFPLLVCSWFCFSLALAGSWQLVASGCFHCLFSNKKPRYRGCVWFLFLLFGFALVLLLTKRSPLTANSFLSQPANAGDILLAHSANCGWCVPIRSSPPAGRHNVKSIQDTAPWSFLVHHSPLTSAEILKSNPDAIVCNVNSPGSRLPCSNSDKWPRLSPVCAANSLMFIPLLSRNFLTRFPNWSNKTLLDIL